MAAGLTDQASRLGVADFARLLGLANASELSDPCVSTLESAPLGYSRLDGPEREACLLKALHRCDAPDLTVSGPHRHDDWQRGWRENLDALATGTSATTVESLVPKYNGHEIVRLAGEYVRAADSGFEYAVYTALRQQLFQAYLGACEGVAEFGCGTGTSLLLLRDLFPDLPRIGLDWAQASQEILARVGEADTKLTGHRFDMFQPSSDFRVQPGFGILTSAALEQLGPDHGPFLDYLLAQSPTVCLHIEPVVELYQPDSLFDEVAIRYHHRRNYLRGFLPRLREHERRGDLELLTVRRAFFGSFYHEGYSVIAWRPTGRSHAGRTRP